MARGHVHTHQGSSPSAKALFGLWLAPVIISMITGASHRAYRVLYKALYNYVHTLRRM